MCHWGSLALGMVLACLEVLPSLGSASVPGTLLTGLSHP